MSRKMLNKSILIIEDNNGDYRLMEEALKETAIPLELKRIDSGTTAEESIIAMQKVGDGKPDLILLDLNLPGKNGKELLKLLKENSGTSKVPVTIFTSSDADRDVSECYKFAANCYVQKPSDFEEYVRTLSLVVRFWFEVVTLPEGDNDDKLENIDN